MRERLSTISFFLAFALFHGLGSSFAIFSHFGRSEPSWSSKRDLGNYYDDVKEEYNSNDDEEYWNMRESLDSSEQRGGVYKVYFDRDIDPTREIQLDWEVYSDGEDESLVLLPPEAVERPTAILHFIGGTFFGSAPKLWYRSFLEGLVRNTQCAVIITPIPVTLLKSPLQHISICKRLKRSFENSWVNILEDEYGDLRDIPLCGVGHSLGARLMVILATMTKNKSNGRIPAFKSFVLVSFTNFGAAAGIPGLSTLLRQSKKQEQSTRVFVDRLRRKTAQRERRVWAFDEQDDDWEDDDWEEIVDDLQELFQEQASRVRNVLTPNAEDLEFYPTPDMLWTAVKEDGRYCIPETLLVQFDNDPIDQSSKLAQILQETDSSDVRFARLRGTHLSPVSVDERAERGLLGISSRASKTVWKAVRGRGKTKEQESAMRDLRQCIARYIADVATK